MPVSSDHHRREADRRFGPRFFATHRLLLPIERLPFPHATMVTSGPLEQCDPIKGCFGSQGFRRMKSGISDCVGKATLVNIRTNKNSKGDEKNEFQENLPGS